MSERRPTTIHVPNMSIKLGRRLLVEPFDLDLHAGEVVIISGESGCGKTTLLQQLYTHCQGSTELDEDTPVIFQRHSASIFKHLTVWQNCHFPHVVAGKDHEVLQGDLLQSFADLGLEALRDTECKYLSHGEQKRVALIRTLSFNSSVVLLDEPTSGLDLSNRTAMLSVLNKWAKQKSAIVVMSSHHQSDFEYGKHYSIQDENWIEV